MMNQIYSRDAHLQQSVLKCAYTNAVHLTRKQIDWLQGEVVSGEQVRN